ncbi:NAD(P)/FAD-dependent oxidoreductase [Methanobacterium alcaliphilum]|uniref:NAD(P)/FAD-dependent oxidoreductase n=1 Tax=Methanobacterium alcaliphilum TaxID=392018 RepID=UPI00200A53E2|nr:NAD(P)/FAD-dependent oxidoreductase [Methanobacterium alcaliphilum]
MYDVIIIGAGPAGSMAAKISTNAGYIVLLVEKRDLPREKSCSGILIQKSIKIIEKEFGEIPEDVFSSPPINKGIIIYNEKGSEFKFESDGYNIWRNLLDEWLTLQTQYAGAEVRTSSPALNCVEKEDYVEVHFKGYVEKAKAVIVCDGAGSKIKRRVLDVPLDQIITYQTFCNGRVDLDNGFFHAFLDSSLSQYDAWLNVKDGYIIIGVGVKDASKKKDYHSCFVSYLKTNYNLKIESFEKAETGLMPHIQPNFRTDLGKGRILFAGDAANLLNPLGEGISSALFSGYAAAEALISCEKADDILKIYNKNLKGEIDYMVRQWKYLGTITKRFKV